MEENGLVTQLDTITATLKHWIADVSDEDLQKSITGYNEGDKGTIKDLVGARLLEISSLSKMLHHRLGIPLETQTTTAFNVPGKATWGPPETKEK